MAYICKFIDTHYNVYILYLILNLPPTYPSKKASFEEKRRIDILSKIIVIYHSLLKLTMKLLVGSKEISDLNNLITKIKSSKKCTQIFTNTKLPLSVLTIKNPFNDSLQVIDNSGKILFCGDKNSFIAISTQHTFLVPEKTPIYIIPADTNNLQKPFNYSAPH